jgi:hypothetical protein
MIGWGRIAFGAVLTALLAAGGLFVFAGQRRGRVALLAGLVSGLGAAGWNSVVHVTRASGFFAEAPYRAFPISWQDGGSAVAALAATTVVLGAGVHRSVRAAQLVFFGVMCGLAALLVDVYFY